MASVSHRQFYRCCPLIWTQVIRQGRPCLQALHSLSACARLDLAHMGLALRPTYAACAVHALPTFGVSYCQTTVHHCCQYLRTGKTAPDVHASVWPVQVDKGGVVVYKMHITQQHINDGFAIGACSAQGSRFKLLLFQQCSDGGWEQLAQASANLTSWQHVENM